MPYPEFDLSQLADDDRQVIAAEVTAEARLRVPAAVDDRPEGIANLGLQLVTARNQGGATIFLCGTEVIEAGATEALADMIEKGLITHLAFNVNAAVLDFGIGKTGKKIGRMPRESGSGYAPGEWAQDVVIPLNAVMTESVRVGISTGEALGEYLYDGGSAHKTLSLLSHAHRWGVPATVHTPTIDPVSTNVFWTKRLAEMQGLGIQVPPEYQHDRLVLANSVENLEQGVVVQVGNFLAPSQFLESLKAARIVAARYGRTIRDFDAALLLGAADPLAEQVRGDGFLAGDESVLRAADEGRRTVLVGDYGDMLCRLHAGALKAGGWDVFA